MAFTAVIGLASGTMAVAATTVMLAIAEVGMALTIVGAVTGNKEIMKVGGTLGLIGGVGGAVAGAASGVAGEVAAEGAAGFMGPPVDELAGLGSIEEPLSGIVQNTASEVITPEASNLIGTQSENGFEQSLADNIVQNPGVNQAQAAPPPVSVTPDPIATNANPTNVSPANSAQASPLDATTGQTGTTNVTGTVTTPNTLAESTGVTGSPDALGDWITNNQDKISAANASKPASDYFSGFLKFAKENDKLMSTGLQLGGSMMNGMQKQSQFDQQMGMAQQRQAWGNSVPSLAPRSLIQSAKV